MNIFKSQSPLGKMSPSTPNHISGAISIFNPKRVIHSTETEHLDPLHVNLWRWNFKRLIILHLKVLVLTQPVSRTCFATTRESGSNRRYFHCKSIFILVCVHNTSGRTLIFFSFWEPVSHYCVRVVFTLQGMHLSRRSVYGGVWKGGYLVFFASRRSAILLIILPALLWES